MKRSMNTRIKVIFLIAVLLIQMANPVAWLPMPSAKAAPVNYGIFQNVEHTLTLDAGSDQLCERNLTGEITFDWPTSSTFVDVVFVQDFSGSFEGTIGDVGAAINTMIDSLNMGLDIDGFTPKDRAMIVTYQGSQGTARIIPKNGWYDGYYSAKDLVHYSTAAGSYNIMSSGLATDADTLKDWVNQNYLDSKVGGGTPTVDGLFEARKRYKDLTPSSFTYNFNESKYDIYVGTNPTPIPRERKTVYILITDGAANTAKWEYLSEAAQNEFKIYTGGNGKIWYKSINCDEPLNSQPGADSRTGSDPNVSYFWRDDREGDDGAYYQSNYYGNREFLWTEAYKPMLTGMKSLAQEIRATGGVRLKDSNPATGSPATFVSAFWEDRAFLTGYTPTGYSTGWDAYMKPKVMAALQNMADDNPDYFATSSTNIGDFTDKLISAFKFATSQIADNVSITTAIGNLPGEFKLFKKEGATYKELIPEAGDQSGVDGQKINIDMRGKDQGSYKIVYHLKEDRYWGHEYQAVPTLTMTYGDTTATINAPAAIPANELDGCVLKPSKFVTKDKADYANRNDYKILTTRRESFYFDTLIPFTSAITNATEKVLISDTIDDRLDILGAYLVAGNTEAKNDAVADTVSGATPDGTLIAQLSDDATNEVPKLTLTGNTISYFLPQKPKTINNIIYPFGGYVGKDYVLVVAVKIKDSLTDAQIEAMRAPEAEPGFEDRLVGVSNWTQVKIDNDEPIWSNRARAVPPAFQKPQIQKYVGYEDAANPEDWHEAGIDLSSRTDTYRYRIVLQMPVDVTTYQTLVVTDTLDATLEVIDANNNNNLNDDVSVAYVNENGQRVPLPIGTYTAVVDTNNKLTVTYKEDDMTVEKFELVSGRQVCVEVPVRIRADADLASKYDKTLDKIIIPNYAGFLVNGTYEGYSGVVYTYVPLSNVSLKKKGNNANLGGAEFTLKDITDTTVANRVFVSSQPIEDVPNSGGDISINNLVPGHIYTLTETKAPSGYMLDPENLWTITVANNGDVSITKGTQAITGTHIEALNEQPTCPAPQKFLKGSSGSGFWGPGLPNEATDTDPYKPPQNDEIITYQVRVPIQSVNGYEMLQIKDVLLSPHLKTVYGSFKVYTLQNPNDTVSGSYDRETMTFTKTSGFAEIEYQTLVLEMQVEVVGTLDEVFATHTDGLIPNTAYLKLNDQEWVPTNTVYFQLTRGEVTLHKTISNSDGTGKGPLPEGVSAYFALYKVVGEPDQINNIVDDIKLGEGAVTGKTGDSGASAETRFLGPGKYYLVEISSPPGYVSENKRIPENCLEILNTGGKVVLETIEANNPKAAHPTVTKMIKGKDETSYNQGVHSIGIGESWCYAIDVLFPGTVDDTLVYTITDDIPEWFEVENIMFFSKANDSTAWPEELDSNQDEHVRTNWWQDDPVQPNHIELIVPVNGLKEDAHTGNIGYKDKIVRIVVQVKVKPGTNLINENALDADGTIPNTAVLTFEKEGQTKTIDSTVYIKPKILRDISFTKKLGSDTLSGALFELYDFDESAPEQMGAPAKHPFTGNIYYCTSDSHDSNHGKVLFEDVPEGTYWLVEKKTPSASILPIYEKIKVTVKGFVFGENDPLYTGPPLVLVQFENEQGDVIFPADANDNREVYNNEKISITGKKTWINDDEGTLSTRPTAITVHMYKEAVQVRGRILVDSIIVTAADSWEYEFTGLDKYYYNPLTDTYAKWVYTIDEEPVDFYSTSISGYDITNELEEVTFRILKKDADTGSAIPGITFVLTDPNGISREFVSSDPEGIVTLTEVKKGVRYTLKEKADTTSAEYINMGSIYVTVDKDGIPRFSSDKYTFPLIDINGVSAYEFLNYKKPDLRKEILADGVVYSPLYNLTNLNETVTYQITVPLAKTDAITTLTLTDTVDSCMVIVPESLRVHNGGNPEVVYHDYFLRELSTDYKTATFTTKPLVDISKLGLENSNLVFEFKSYINKAPLDFVALHPELKVDNKATLEINPHNPNRAERINTNEVTLQAQLTSVKFKKMLALQDPNEQPIALPTGETAEFSLTKQDDSLFLYAGRTLKVGTDEFFIDNLNVGKYLLKETKAPNGYVTVSPVEFEVRRVEVSQDVFELKAFIKNANGVYDIETTNNNLGDLVDPLPEKPTISKMVRKTDPVSDTETYYKDYDMSTWKENFEYVIDVAIPSDVSGYTKIRIFDDLPLGIEMLAGMKMKLGSKTGSDFIDHFDVIDPVDYANLMVAHKPIISRDAMTGRYSIETETEIPYVISRLAGVTIRIILPVRIHKDITDISQLDGLVNGSIVNTATVCVNDKIRLEDSAKVKPVDDWFVLRKIADFRHEGQDVPLYGAVFNLYQYFEYDDVQGVQLSGPELPAGIQTRYEIDDDGYAVIDARLEAGKYLLAEDVLPYGYVLNGVQQPAHFIATHYDYLLEVEKLATGGNTVKLSARDANGDAITPAIYEGEMPTKENPAKIVNRQIVEVPVDKLWDDENNRHNTRSDTIKLLLQRSIVKDKPDVLDPVTGKLVPLPGDQSSDEPDTAFNQAAIDDPYFNPELNLREIPMHFYNETLFRYTENGELYNYYVLETPPDGYEASYTAVEMDQLLGDFTTPYEVQITNTLIETSSDFTLLKQDDSKPANTLAGAVFNLSYVDKYDQEVTQTKTSNADGIVYLSGMLGNTTYTLREKRAPEGYQADTTVYTIEVDENGVPRVKANDAYLAAPRFTVTEATETTPVSYQLIVNNKKLDITQPQKAINGGNSYKLSKVDSVLNYTVDVPVKGVDDMTSFVIEDKVNELLSIVADSGKVTADGVTISTSGNLVVSPDGKTIKFSLNSGFDKIANSTVRLSFKAKLAYGVTFKQLKDYVAKAENKDGVPNTATLMINDKSANSNTVYLLPEDPGGSDTTTYPTIRVPFNVGKKLENGILKGGEYKFQLRDKNGALIEEVTNTADGTVIFSDRTFSKEVSNWTYTISEVEGGDPKTTYDKTVYTVKVTTKAIDGKLKARVDVEKNGVPYDRSIVFTNCKDMPPTGDNTLQVIGILLVLALITLAGAYVLKRRRRK